MTVAKTPADGPAISEQLYHGLPTISALDYVALPVGFKTLAAPLQPPPSSELVSGGSYLKILIPRSVCLCHKKEGGAEK